MNPKQTLRNLLDQYARQIGMRLPSPEYSGTLPKVDLADLAQIGRLLVDLAQAERDYAEIPDQS